MKSADLGQMCDHITVHPNVLINKLKQCFIYTRLEQKVTINNRRIKNLKYDFIYELYISGAPLSLKEFFN